MEPSEFGSATAQLQESDFPGQTGRVVIDLATPSTSSTTSLQSQTQPISFVLPPFHYVHPKYSPRSQIFLNAPRQGGQPTCEPATELVSTASIQVLSSIAIEAVRTAMAEFGKTLIEQNANQKHLRQLPQADAMSVDHMEMEVEMGGDIEMVAPPRTPPQRSRINYGVLTPPDEAAPVNPNKPDAYPFTWSGMPIDSTLSEEQTPIRAPGTSPAIYYDGRGTLAPPRVSGPASEEEMKKAPDYMMPLPNPYFPNRGMISNVEVSHATDALLAHMRVRHKSTQESSHNLQMASRISMPPLPQAMIGDRSQLNLPYRDHSARSLPPPDFKTPEHISIKKHHQTRSLSDILAAERSKSHSARSLDGLSFHHVVQQPFANELRAHYMAADKNSRTGLAITMYKLQLPVPETARSHPYEQQTELWYFFALSGQPAPEHTIYNNSIGPVDRAFILALPALDMEENKSEECPLFRGGAQIDARRREYTIRAGGRFRLETRESRSQMQTWMGIRQDLETGSCRLFTWMEV